MYEKTEQCRMYSIIKSASVLGISAFIVDIEMHLDNQLPSFQIVGLPDSAVKESRERVTAAVKNSGFSFPSKKITVNLAPADVRKAGSGFDLPIAIALLACTGLIPNENLEGVMALGELSLDGTLRPIHGTLSISVEARDKGFKQILVPAENAAEAALVDGIDVYPIHSLKECYDFLNQHIQLQKYELDTAKLFKEEESKKLEDFEDVKGQENVKRALEVSAAGGHNVLMIGPPGSGKTMLAKRVPTILPPLSIDEALETTKIHSIAGLLAKEQAIVSVRPFRAPHHTISDAALVGGGMNMIRPGEISLAHHGVLFLDELPEFKRNVLEVLRQPLEEKAITISRTKMTIEYPANFMLVCSMNPSPDGGSPDLAATSSPAQIKRYLGKVSGPLLDRIDIHLEVPAVRYEELSSKRKGESSAAIRERVVVAREIQIKRLKEEGIYKNADMNTKQIAKYCPLSDSGTAILKTAMERLGLSARAYDRILKVARTIADLENKADIEPAHLAEAIQYRTLDREYWG